jgi:hypothetical protein
MNWGTNRIMAAALALLVAAPLGAQEGDGTSGCDGGPGEVVARFLALSPEQASGLGQIIVERQQALAPILAEIAAREQRIRELVAGGGSPAEIGVLVVQVHALRGQAEEVQRAALARFESLLAPEQRGRWQQVRLAARLQPVVPAFAALQLL